jgi:hypothetical protein
MENKENTMKRKRNLENIPKGECVCSVCNIKQDNLNFQWYMQRFTKDGFRLRVNTNCSDCSKRIGKELNEIKKKILKNHPKPKDGEPCDMCHKPVYPKRKDVPKGVDGTWSWQCDHDHDTKEFRGWLCKKCNTGFGGIGDTLESVLNLVEYKFGSVENFVDWRNNNGV